MATTHKFPPQADEERALELIHRALESEGRRERAIERPINARWPNGVVPYRLGEFGRGEKETDRQTDRHRQIDEIRIKEKKKKNRIKETDR